MGRDEGSASLEFITAGMLLLLPMVYLVLVMSALQGGAFAVEGAARQAVSVFVRAENEQAARAVAERAIGVALADYGLGSSASEVQISCDPGACLTRLRPVTVSVRVSVPLPLVPPMLDLAVPLSIPVQASATQQVSRFWGAR
ncbi:MAG: putative rane/secreted protein [Microbacteriaceae bacterium]|jgi:hypothetical protein|nr:putative rane/secreted protein [Microbacteriaceae bacterium]HEV7957640.1 hypothetical protein [Marisediminicola sp.]